MLTTEIKELYKTHQELDQKEVCVSGWVRTIRDSKAFGFIELNDGTFFKNIQIVFAQEKLANYAEIAALNVGAALRIRGILLETPQSKQPFEIQAEEIIIEGTSTPDYPLQKKRHSVEYLRQIAHLRPRSNLFSAVFRIRSMVAFAIHKFFNKIFTVISFF